MADRAAADVREAVDTATIAVVVATVVVATAEEVEDRDARINGADRHAVVLTANRRDSSNDLGSMNATLKIAARRCRSFLLERPHDKSRWRRCWRRHTRTIT